MLRPQDILVLCWFIVRGDEPWRYLDIASELDLSPSEAHAAMGRLYNSGLILRGPITLLQPRRWSANIENFLIHGVPYVFYGERGPVCRGMPTGVAAPPLNQEFSIGGEIPVWPDPEGEARGYNLKPLYKSVPVAARKNQELYEILALIDALRDGRAREQQRAAIILKEKLNEYAKERAES